MSTIEDRLLRVEIILLLAEAPSDWVKPTLVEKLQGCGYSLEESRQILINNFGKIPDNIKYFTDKLDNSEEHY